MDGQEFCNLDADPPEDDDNDKSENNSSEELEKDDRKSDVIHVEGAKGPSEDSINVTSV